jgi:hypothetical protein
VSVARLVRPLTESAADLVSGVARLARQVSAFGGAELGTDVIATSLSHEDILQRPGFSGKASTLHFGRGQHGERPGMWAPGETLLIDWGSRGVYTHVLQVAGLGRGSGLPIPCR